MKKFYLILIFVSFALSANSQTLQWRLLNNSPVPDSASLRFEDIYFANADTGWIVMYSGKVFRTTDGGASWSNVLTSAFYPFAWFRSTGFFNSTTGILGTLDTSHVMYRTTNGGNEWSQITPLPVPAPTGICGISIVNSDIAYACGTYEGPARIIKTTDRGLSWTTVFSDSSMARTLVDCYFWSADSGMAVGGYNTNHYYDGRSVVIITTNGGSSWRRTYMSARTGEWGWKISFVSENTGFVSIENTGGNSFILKTTNAGSNWNERPFINGYNEEGIGFINENSGWVGGWSGPTYKTTNSGANWQLAGWGTYVNRFRFLNDTLAYSVGSRVYKYSYGSVGIHNISEIIPDKFLLYQNYPNPFNPVTKIRFSIPVTQYTILRVYDVLGKEVATLVNEKLSAGTYETEFIGNNLPSGIYFYQIMIHSDKSESNNFVQTKRMTLIK